MITSLIEYYDVEIDSYYATILLSGIVLDTNNFTLNTTSETYYSAYYLANLGASAKKVQYLLKQDIEEYTERQKLMSSIETIDDKVAFTKASPYTHYRREDLAKVADTLLFFNNIEASFVVGKIGKGWRHTECQRGTMMRRWGQRDLNPRQRVSTTGGATSRGIE